MTNRLTLANTKHNYRRSLSLNLGILYTILSFPSVRIHKERRELHSTQMKKTLGHWVDIVWALLELVVTKNKKNKEREGSHGKKVCITLLLQGEKAAVASETQMLHNFIICSSLETTSQCPDALYVVEINDATAIFCCSQKSKV